MKRSTIFGWGATIVVTAAVVVGFIQAGSPADERARRFDQQRVTDLQSLSAAIDQYYNNAGSLSLPATIDDLRKSRDIYLMGVTDPETGVAYEYRSTGKGTYELCATFTTDSANDQYVNEKSMPVPVGSPPMMWSHGAQRTCFQLKANAWNVKQ